MKNTIKSILEEANKQENLAYYCVNKHNVYLKPSDPSFKINHPRNKTVISSKACITDDQVSTNSFLRVLYSSKKFKDFLCEVLNEEALYKYNDELSSINIHYAKEGQELGWHFDNSSFAITLLLQSPQAGGQFEYVPQLRNASQGDMNYAGVDRVLKGEVEAQAISMGAGDLMLFRGRDALHRVTPSQGEITRMLVVLAYNAEPNVALSESARMTFYGRLT